MAKTLGFIGLGVMGKPMAGHLIAAGHTVYLYTIEGVPADLVAAGGKAAGSAAEVAKAADIIFTMVPDTPHVEAVLFGDKGVAEGFSAGKIVVDMTSISPIETKKFAEKIEELGGQYLDAPVSGGEVGAKAASLTIMVGGDEAAFDEVKPLFELMGKNITLVGGNGDGQTTKVANQIIVALNIQAVAEALVFASKAGADPAKVRAGADGRLRHLAHPRSARRAHDQAHLQSGLPDRAAPEGSVARAERRPQPGRGAAEHRDCGAADEWSCREWRRPARSFGAHKGDRTAFGSRDRRRLSLHPGQQLNMLPQRAGSADAGTPGKA